MQEQISLNYANCLKEFAGEHSLNIDELKGFQGQASKAFEAIEKQKAAGKLGFMELPFKNDMAKKIKLLARKISGKFENFVVIGIGGSALGNIALQQALKHPFWNLLPKKERKGALKIFVPDNVDPDMIAGLTNVIDFKKTIFNVISKSGTTAECMANYFVLKKILQKNTGKKYSDRIIITTDAAKGALREEAIKEKILSFEVPSNVGGRFSVLTPVGLVSAAFAGIDIEKILAGAAQMAKRCQTADLLSNPAALFAVIQYLFFKKGRNISVMMPYSNALYGMADWYRQLWAESLGKKSNRKNELVYTGPTPVKALGATDQHSQVQLYIEGPHDKIITFLSVKKFNKNVVIPSYDKHYLGGQTLNQLLKAEEEATRLALAKEGRPNLTIELPSLAPEHIGELIYMLELATAYAGEFLDINAFDQPGVELGKQLTYALMGRPGFEKKKAEIEQDLPNPEKSKYII